MTMSKPLLLTKGRGKSHQLKRTHDLLHHQAPMLNSYKNQK